MILHAEIVQLIMLKFVELVILVLLYKMVKDVFNVLIHLLFHVLVQIDFSTSCKNGYTLQNSPGRCTACNAQYCLKCDTVPNALPNAQCDPFGCQVGYFIDNSNRCVSCFNNCPVCR